MKSFFRLQVVGGFLIVLSALGGLTFLAGKNNQGFLTNTQKIIHFNQILSHTKQVRLLVTDMETSQRGYAIAHDSSFLRPYHQSLPVLDANVRKLDSLLRHFPLGNDPIPQLRLLIRRKNDSTSRIIQTRNESFERARQLVASGHGQQIMDSIRVLTDYVETAVNSQLDQTRRARESEMQKFRSQVIGIIAIAVVLLVFLLWLIDFTFRKRIRAEVVLQRTIAQKDDLYQKAPCGYFTLDRSLRITRVNDTFLHFTGLTRHELERNTIIKFLSPESGMLLKECLSAGKMKERFTVDLDFITATNEIFSGTASFQRFDSKNGKVRCSVIDCRERKIADLRILELNRELEEFSYSVSHDLRSPLRIINGYASMLKEDHPELLTPDSVKILDVIINNARKMGNLIDDLLSFARVGRTEVQKEETNFRSMVESSLAELTTMESKQKIHVNIGEMSAVPSDVLLMKQVWLNLLSNAIKYSSGKDEIQIEIGSFTRDRDVCYFVRDHGAGFNPSYKDKLFKVFQRLHRDDEFPGTGVGLALVKKIITRQGGSVWAESAPGKGATFFFSLPNV